LRVDEIIKSGISRADVVRVRSALNPLLWALPPTCWATAYVFRDDSVLRYAQAPLGALPLFAVIIAYFLFLFRDPDRLQSEEYVLKLRELSLISRKGIPPLIDDIVLDDDMLNSGKNKGPVSPRLELDKEVVLSKGEEQ
jgi:hypothetical protein